MNSWSKTSCAAKFLIFIKLSDERNINVEWYYRLNVCAPPHTKNIHMLKPNPQYVGIWKQGFGRWLGHKGGALMNAIRAFTKETPETLLLCHVRILWEDNSMNLHQKTKLPVPYSWTSQPTELWEVNFHIYKLLGLWYSVIEARTC